MNLLDHYILEIHSVKDIEPPDLELSEPLYEVDLTIDCYGVVERITKWFLQSDWERIKEQGCYLA